MATETEPSGSGLRRLYRSLWHFAREKRRLVVAFLLLLLAAQGIRLAIPYLFGESVNALQTNGVQDVGRAALYTAFTLGAAFLAWALHGPGRVIERFTAVAIRERFADELYAKAVSLPLAWQECHHSGETIQRMGRATQALFGFSQHQFIYLQNLVSLIGPIGALFFLSPATGSAALSGYAVIALLLVKFDGQMLRLHARENAAERRYAAELSDCLGNISTVHTLRLQDATRRSLAARYSDVSAPLKGHVVVNEAKWCAIDLLNNALRIGLVVLYAWLSWRQSGLVLVGTAVMVHQYAQQIGNVVSSMATHWQDLVRFQADIASADDILAAASRPEASRPIAGTDWQHIRIERLTYSHASARGDGPTLADITLDLRRGERVALIGESGSGKSTLLRVLAGLYEADDVGISIDGQPVDGLSHLGAIATLVPQDPEIFEASIERNVTMGIDYPPEQVTEALRLACFAPILAHLPEGLATVITERGLNFSGGQKQRLALARGILASHGCSLIMLDEPTSSIDPVTEARIYDALMAEFPHACIISSLHRLHLLPRFDRVVRMAGGRIVGIGSPAELVEKPAA